MAVGMINFPEMKPVSGITLGTANAGIKQTFRPDLLVIQMVEGTNCAGVFTQNAFCAAPVLIAKNHLIQSPRWLLINSGNANAGTGEQGITNAFLCCSTLAALVGGQAAQVLPFSTGVIGEPLAVEKIDQALPTALAHLAETHWEEAARAIMTTDTFAKGATRYIVIDGKRIAINGIAKGSGMIQPNMATMLAFIATDANVHSDTLQRALSAAVEQSFNRISVDGDTSTNDACILMATGLSHAEEITEHSRDYLVFFEALLEVCKELAELIIRDGEGATKLIRIVVEEASDDQEAVRVAKTIAHSPLVKTAFFASDPNWGRILAAIGRSGLENMVLEKVQLYLGEVCIVENGARASNYTEAEGVAVMHRDEITVTVILGRGHARQEVLTCDFSYDYVKINAEYRT
jgi:glutamate N-acetyltransferase/amino-acid N-acetyltransferase